MDPYNSKHNNIYDGPASAHVSRELVKINSQNILPNKQFEKEFSN